MKTKRIASLLLAVVLLCTTVLSVSAASGTVLDWTQFRGSALGAGTTDAKLPTSPLEVEEKWSIKLGSGWTASAGTPIIVGDSVYVYGNGNLNRIDRESGKVVKAVPCEGSSQFFSQIAYGEGMIFVPRAVTRTIDGKNRDCAVVYAYDEQSMELLWISDPLGNPQDQLQPLSAITYYNGYLYMGVSNAEADKGAFVCLSAKDEQPQTSEERKAPVWTYSAEQGNGGFYWSAGAIVGNAIVFAGENGVLVSHSLTDSRVYDTVMLEENPYQGVRSTVAYDDKTGRVFVSSKSGMLHSVKVSASGMFDEETKLSKQLGRDITSSPVVYNGRVYQGGGGIESEAGFSVLDAETLTVIYTIPEIQTQSSPILTTAYASSENDNTVYLYVTKYAGFASNSSCTYVIKDKEGQTKPSYEELITPSQAQYCTQSLTVGEDGSFCYYNDSATIFYFGYKNPEDGQYTPEDVQRAIGRIPAVERITLYDETAVARTQERFSRLTAAQQNQVANAAVLRAAVERLAQLTDEAVRVTQLIDGIAKLNIDQLTVEDYADVMALQAQYQALSQDGKAQVSNREILDQAVEMVTNLKDRQDAQRIAGLIAALPELDRLTKGDADAVNRASVGYQNLSEGAKAFIEETLRIRLEQSKKRVDFLVKEIDAINLAIWKLPVDQITLNDQEAVSDIVTRYQALGEANQSFVKGYADVQFAQRVIEGLGKNQIIAAVFDRLKGQDKTYTFMGDAQGREYTVAFSGQSIVNSIDFAAGLSFAPPHAAEISALSENALAFSTQQQGDFPGTAEFTMTVELPDGMYQLYRYSEQSGKAEKVQQVSVASGKAQFSFGQGGEYFLAKSLKEAATDSEPGKGNNPAVQTGDQVKGGGMVILALAAGISMLVLRRKKQG